MSWDPERGLLITNTNRLAFMVRLLERSEYDDELSGSGRRLSGEYAGQRGTPYGMYREPLVSPNGIPCNAPPWGTLTAVDLATGLKRWEVPLGKMSMGTGEIHGLLNLGGSLVTGGGLTFIAATRGEDVLRAFDTDTGHLLWQSALPAGGQATPMAYTIDGRQFVVIAAGGHGKLGTKQGDSLIAFALPD